MKIILPDYELVLYYTVFHLSVTYMYLKDIALICLVHWQGTIQVGYAVMRQLLFYVQFLAHLSRRLMASL